jgi:diguanylate cyclase (GGDEF)-like protein
MLNPVARILLLGSQPAEYSRLSDLLESSCEPQYQLLWCERQQSALSEISSGNYDVVLLDCAHQSDTALTLLQEITQQDCKVPIVALTEHVSEPIVQKVMRLGATDVLCLGKLDSYLLERCLSYAVEKHAADKKLAELSLYDPLTGVPNRVLFRQAMEESIERAKVDQVPLALLLINLDGFKKVNEVYGSEAGDQLVATMAKRLNHCVRKSDCLARVGADEFTLMLEDCETKDDIALVAKKVIDVLSNPFMVSDAPLMISCSIGIATYPESGDTVDGLLRRANMAMVQAKSQRGSQYCFYNKETSAQALHRLNMEADIRRALRRNEFEMYYQPRVALETGETVGMEALIRWRHPERGLVSPNDFIPVAEESGLIVPLGYWIIQQACQDLIELDKVSSRPLDVAVNLSFRQLQDSMFVETASRIIEQSGADATRLEFELTETAIMSNYQETYEGMMALSKLGITFSLDDFGTGFSSFAHIQRLPISALKIDRSFIKNVVSNSEDAIIVKAMINLARSLNLYVVAEGVETLDQVQFLWQNYCDQVQGFYFSPAVPIKDMSLMLNQRATACM